MAHRDVPQPLGHPWRGVQALAQIALSCAPAMNRVFGMAPLDGGAWVRILAIAPAASVVNAVEKWMRRLRASNVVAA
jgi:hypothetical protein